MNGKDKISKINLPTSFQAEGVNVFLIHNDTLTLVDAGQNVKGAWDAFTAQLKSLGYQVKDIQQIILTHSHVDHTGLVHYFDHDVKLIGHPSSERWLHPTSSFLEQHDFFFQDFFHQIGVPPHIAQPYLAYKHRQVVSNAQRSLDIYVEEGAEIPGLPQWMALHTIGHAQGHLSLFHRQDKILIGGDVLLPHISPNPIIEPPLHRGEEREKPQLQMNETLRRLLSFSIQRVLPGHGEDILNPNELIQHRLERQHERAMQVREWLMEELMTIFEVCQRLFPKSYQSTFGFTLFETVGQIDYLLSHQFITEEQIKSGLNMEGAW
ncbi:MBL fold metallo-hydrolase [Brevibacillus sp. IT-7CA2]|uniref:MBL fold metallo-hydrolase n=1 Tax=Brevibacillus sp. IT-7CA2 TaxID=3026436 RepID=UPI0039E0385A